MAWADIVVDGTVLDTLELDPRHIGSDK